MKSIFICPKLTTFFTLDHWKQIAPAEASDQGCNGGRLGVVAGPRPGDGRAHCPHRAAAHPAPATPSHSSHQEVILIVYRYLLSWFEYFFIHTSTWRLPGEGRVLVGLVAGPAPGTMSTQSLDSVYRRLSRETLLLMSSTFQKLKLNLLCHG